MHIGVAQHTAVGSETQVNTTTNNSQQNPSVAGDNDGRFVVVWESFAQDGDDDGIFMQLYNADGSTNGSETQVNATTANAQSRPDVAKSASNGTYTVTWMSDGQDNDGWGIYHARYNASGVQQSSDILTNQTTAGQQKFPQIADEGNGDYVIVWMGESGGNDGFDIYARRYNSGGSAQGGEFIVNTTTDGYQGYPSVAMDNNGDFVVAWQSTGEDGEGSGIYAQRYNTNGVAQGSEFLVNTTTAGNQQEPSVAMDNSGDFVITWSSYAQDGSEDGIYAQIYGNTGVANGAEFKVNTTTAGMQAHPEATMSQSGDIAISWSSYGQDGSYHGVYFQTYSFAGSPIEGETLVNTRTADFQQFSAGAIFNDTDSLVIVWQDGNRNSSSTHDGSDYGVFMQRFTLDLDDIPNAVCQNITVNLDAAGNVTIAATDVDGGSTDNGTIVSHSVTQSAFSCSDVGNNTITLTVTDDSGLSDACSARVRVEDVIAPVAVCQNFTASIGSGGSVTVLGTSVDNGSSDACGVSVGINQNSFNCNHLGDNTVTLTVLDPGSNSASCTAIVTIEDNEAPSLACPANATVDNDAGLCTANYTYSTPAGSDNCGSGGLSIVLSSGLGSGGDFPVGTNTETWQITDASGNTASCSFTVTVNDIDAPSISCPANISASTDTGICEATVTFVDATGTDNCGTPTITQTLGGPSGSVFSPGTFNVAFQAEDAAGNTSNCSFSITVSDTEAPVLTCADITVNADAGLCYADLAIDQPGITDNCDSWYVLDMDGADDRVAIQNHTYAGTSYTQMTVEAWIKTATTADQVIASFDRNEYWRFEIGGNAAGSGTGKLGIGIMTDAGQLDFGGKTVVTDGEWHHVAAVFDNGTASLYIDGNLDTSTTFGAMFGSGNTRYGFVGVGSEASAFNGDTGPDWYFNGLIDEIRIWDTARTQAEIQSAMNNPLTGFETNLNIYYPFDDGPGNSTASDRSFNSNTGTLVNTDNNTVWLSTANNSTTFSYTLTNDVTGTEDASGIFSVGSTTVNWTVSDEAGNTNACSQTITVNDTEAPTVTCAADISTTILSANCDTFLTVAPPTISDNCGSHALELDGIDDYIAIDNFFYTGTGHTEVTVEAWVKIPAGGDNNIIASYDRSDFWRLEIGGDISPVGYIGWAVMTDAGVIDCVSNTPVDDGQWHHIAGVYDNGFVGVYIDGQLDNSTTFGTTFGNTTTRYGYIGVGSEATSYNNGIGPALYFGGEIDEVRIWDVARSQTELQSNKDIFLTGAETGLTAYYPMDEGNGNSTTTDLANGYVGYLQNTDNDSVWIASAIANTVFANDFNGTADASDTYSVGTTTITWTATDRHGNSANCTQDVVVTETIAPSISCPTNILTGTDPGECGAAVTFPDATTTDNCYTPTVTQTAGLPSGSLFDKGINTITFTATDSDGNTADCSFTITVTDTTRPVIFCPTGHVQNVPNGTCERTATLSPPGVSDNCDAYYYITDTIERTTDGDSVVYTFPNTPTGAIAAATLTVYVRGDVDAGSEDFEIYGEDGTHIGHHEGGGNQCSSTFQAETFTISAATINSWAADGSISIAIDASASVGTICNAQDDAYAILEYLTGNISVVNDYNGTADASDTYPVGTTAVTWTATDASGNVTTCVQNVTINDNRNPSITCAPDTTVSNDAGVCDAFINVTPPDISDNCGFGSGLQMDGTNEYVAIDNFYYNSTGLQEVTVEAWINTSASSPRIVASYDRSDYWRLEITNAGIVQFDILTDAGLIDFPGNTVVNDGEWHHIAGVFDNGLISIYVDGTLDSSTTHGTTFGAGSTRYGFVGAGSEASSFNGNTHDYYNGKVDEVRIWDVARTGAQIQASMDIPLLSTENGLVAYFDMEDGTGSSTATDVANGNNGTLVNMEVNEDWINSAEATLTLTNNFTGTNDASGTYPVGTTAIVWTVTDLAGNSRTCSQTVTVNDTAGPVAICQNLTLYLDNGGNATVLPTDIDNGSHDNCIISYAAVPSSVNCNNLGTTPVTLTITDEGGNTDNCPSIVTVLDTISPQITCPSNAVLDNDAGQCGAIFSYNLTTSDNCGTPTVVLTSGLGSGSFFPVGTTTEQLTATDGSGNSKSCSFTVTINDTETPVITCPNDTIISTDASVCEAVFQYISPTATDNCDASFLETHFYNGHFYFLEETNANWINASANAINMGGYLTTISDQAEQDFVYSLIVDATYIGFTDTAVEGTFEWVNGEPITYTNWAQGEPNNNLGDEHYTRMRLSDGQWNDVWIGPNDDYVVEFNNPIGFYLSSGNGSGGTFPLGVNTETWTVVDSAGNSSSCSFTVTVTDTEAPLAVCTDVTASLDNFGNAFLTTNDVENGSTDNCGTDSAYLSTTVFDCDDTGTNAIVMSVTDEAGNIGVCQSNVTIEDITAPQISCPNDTILTNDPGICGVIFNYTAPAGTDNCPASSTALTGGLGSGATFPIGITTETYTVMDASNNQASCSFTVTVSDTESPVIGCPANVVVSNDIGLCEAIVNYNPPIGTDNCPGVVTTLTAGLGSGSSFPVGVTTESYEVTDAAGQSASCSFTITVNDDEAPVITCPANTTVSTDPGSCDAIVTYITPVGTDNCPGTITIQTLGLGSGASFPLGTTTETHQVTDATGNLVDCSFIITVNDNEAPTINCPTDITVNNDVGICGAVVTYLQPALVDNCPSHTMIQSAGLGSGATFPVGTTTETYQTTDTAGNQASCSFTVTVSDTENPAISCPANITVNNDLGVCGATISYLPPTGTDNCPGAVTAQVAGLGSGSIFPVGVTTETYEVTDAAGNTSQCSFVVMINDAEPPFVECPTDISVNNTPGFCEAVVTYTMPTHGDNCAGQTITLAGGNGSGFAFPVGVSTENYMVTDASGNTENCSFTIIVTDDEAPTIVCPADITLNNDIGQCSAQVGYTAPFGTDNCGGATTAQIAGLGNGQTFPLGTTTETYQVTDTVGNTANCTFTVTVVDAESPLITCPADVIVGTDISECGAIVTFIAPVGTDNCPGATTTPTTSLGSGAFFPAGISTVAFEVNDGAGNAADCSFTITVNDGETPSISCPADITVLSNSSSCDAVVTYISPVGTDNCPGAITMQTTGLGNGATFPTGTTTEAFEVTDAVGATASCSFNVTVQDTTSPVISNCPADIDNGCAQIVAWLVPTATDNCIVADFISNHNSGDFFAPGTHTVNYVATDPSGNATTCSFDVTVYALPTANAGEDRTLCFDDKTVLGGNPTGQGGSGLGYTYIWTNPGSSLDNPTVANPIAAPDGTTTYLVFVIDGISGCAATDMVTVSVVPAASNGVRVVQHQKVSVDSGDVNKPTQLLPLLNKKDGFGQAIAALGNISGNGEADVAVGAYLSNIYAKDAGEVFILSLDENGKVVAGGITQIGGDLVADSLLKSDYFGYSLAAGDLNNDGIPDLAVGALKDENELGTKDVGTVHLVYLDSSFNNIGGVTICDTSLAPFGITLAKKDQFGSAVSITDINGDGNNDLIVGADLRHGGGLVDAGSVFILFMDGQGGILNVVEITDGSQLAVGTLVKKDGFGSSVATTDINGDEIPDLAIGAKKDDTDNTDAGALYTLIMNANGTVATNNKITIGAIKKDWFGNSVSALDDIDGDGVPELLVGSMQNDDEDKDAGRASILYLNADGTMKALINHISDMEGNFFGKLDKKDNFGVAVANLHADLDGNCINEVMVGATLDDSDSTGVKDIGAGWVLWLEPVSADAKAEEPLAISPVQVPREIAAPSSLEEVVAETASMYLNIYPNPTDGRFEIQVSTAEIMGGVEIEVVSLLGKKVYQWAGNVQNRISRQVDLAVQPSGHYLVRVTTSLGKSVGLLNLTK